MKAKQASIFEENKERFYALTSRHWIDETTETFDTQEECLAYLKRTGAQVYTVFRTNGALRGPMPAMEFDKGD